MDKDSAGDSKFVVAGRIFWEVNLFRPNLTSYTTSGFFAQKGYVEPKAVFKNENLVAELVLSLILVVLFCIMVFYCVKKQQKEKKQKELEYQDHRQSPMRQQEPDQ